jgi:copper(I)-binding protein
MKISAIVLVLTISTGMTAWAETSQDGSIQVEQAWARIAPNEPNTASVFFEVISRSDHPDALVAATSSSAQDVLIRSGKWKGWDFFNKESQGIKIKANKRTSFHPGKYEVTLKNFNDKLNVGTTLPVTLVFKEAGTIMIEAKVSNQLLGNRIAK